MVAAARWDGCVAGKGRPRRTLTSGSKIASSSRGKGEYWKSEPAGWLPVEPEATSLVNNWASFFAPVSTNRAW